MENPWVFHLNSPLQILDPLILSYIFQFCRFSSKKANISVTVTWYKDFFLNVFPTFYIGKVDTLVRVVSYFLYVEPCSLSACAFYQPCQELMVHSMIACQDCAHPAITCSKLTIETLEQRREICSKLTIKTPFALFRCLYC